MLGVRRFPASRFQRHAAKHLAKRLSLLAHGLCLLAVADTADTVSQNRVEEKPTVIVVVGAAGEEEFGKTFAKSAALWEKACLQAGVNYVALGPERTNDTSDVARLKQLLADEPKDSANELWLVLLGHGTFDGKEPRFNLRGPDVSATDLAEWLKPIHRRVAIIDAASASAPFMSKLSASNRVVVTATRSGYEQNYARFGLFISEAIADPNADLDKDGQTSLLEAFLAASRRVVEFYETEGRLATEHALIDDNGDGLGTPADWFRGIRAEKKAADNAPLDGLRAHQFHLVRSGPEQKMAPEVRERRDKLELAIAGLRERKASLKEDDYFRQLEELLLELAKLYGAEPEKP